MNKESQNMSDKFVDVTKEMIGYLNRTEPRNVQPEMNIQAAIESGEEAGFGKTEKEIRETVAAILEKLEKLEEKS